MLLLASTFEIFNQKIDMVPHLELSKKHVLCIPTAAYAEEDYNEWLWNEITPIRDRAKSFKIFDISCEDRASIEKAVSLADIVYVTGGNTYVLLDAMQKCEFGIILEEHLRKGKTYIGCSAGAVITCPTIEYMDAMDDSSKADLTSFSGLNLVDFLIVPHIDSDVFCVAVQKIIDSLKKEKVIGLKDDQALFIRDNYYQIF
ncbi:MAG: Type 1 glutamine amidotransferase-like domain-containing protein [Rhodospirillales bacterium]|nr:Type 1 glutamine amidotransferase-like domain-containing protein [Rhodospirillales bacterium]